jgi:hypothetical protein
MSARFNGPFTALLAAALFGATTPFAKALLVLFVLVLVLRNLGTARTGA